MGTILKAEKGNPSLCQKWRNEIISEQDQELSF